MSITDTIARVRSFAAHMGWKKGRYAREAKIQKTTLRDFDRPGWNPTRETLERLESVIPDNYGAPANSSSKSKSSGHKAAS